MEEREKRSSENIENEAENLKGKMEIDQEETRGYRKVKSMKIWERIMANKNQIKTNKHREWFEKNRN